MRILLVFLLYSLSANAATLEDYLFARGYSNKEVSEIIAGGNEVKRVIDMRYKLAMLGYSEQEIDDRINRTFPGRTVIISARAPITPSVEVQRKVRLVSDDVESIIQEASDTYDIPKALISAVIHTESSFRRDAVSVKGARGLMQLMPGTAQELGVRNAFDPYENIMGGTKYLRLLMYRFDSNLDLVLAAYNAGPRTVEESGRQVPKSNLVRKYVFDVKRRYREYSL